jgi:uncharacterized protein (TIGR00369 family)
MNLNVRSIFLMSQAIGKASMIPAPPGPHHQRRLDRRAGRQHADMKTIAYNTSKAPVVNFTAHAGRRMGQYNINVNALAPAFFPSKMTKGRCAAVGADKMARRAPLLRLGDDDDLKGATLLFASRAGKHITGRSSPIDGGVSAITLPRLPAAPWTSRSASRSSRRSASSCSAASATRREIAVELRDELTNSWGVAHGGVTMTLLDVVMAHAARAPARAARAIRSARHVEMKTTFMRPALGRLVGKGRCLHRTASMAFCEASVHRRRRQLVAHATGTFKALKGLPVGGKRIQRNALRLKGHACQRLEQADPPGLPPRGRAPRRQLPPRRGAEPEPREGQVLCATHFLSLDPYMRGRMNDAKSYAQPQRSTR